MATEVRRYIHSRDQDRVTAGVTKVLVSQKGFSFVIVVIMLFVEATDIRE